MGATSTSHVLTNNAPMHPAGTPVTPPADHVLRLDVGPVPTTPACEPRLPAMLREARFAVGRPTERTRRLLLFEDRDEYGRARPLLGTVERGTSMEDAPTTETPALGTSEVRELYNATDDTHPGQCAPRTVRGP